MSEEQKYMMAVPGDNVTALHMNNEINIFGMYTSIKTTQFVTYPMIQYAIKAVEKKVENEDAFWRNLAIGAIATVALAAAAVAVVCTGGAALAAFALAGAAVGTGLVTAGASISDYKNGSARSTGDFLVQMVTGGAIGAFVGATIYMVAPVLPQVSSMMSTGICAEFGISSVAAGTALTYGIMGGGYLSLAGSTAFAADQAFALGSGESVLLNTVFDGNQNAYDTAFMVCDTLTMGYLDMSMQYRMACGSQTASSADDTTDETRQGNKNNVNMDASGNNADDTNGTGPKNTKASTNTTGNTADDAETLGTSGAKASGTSDDGVETSGSTSKKSGVYLEKGETPVESGTSSRPTWRQSELDAAKDFPDYDAQKSFINGEEVPYGTKGSVRPDYYKNGYSVDIKNYNVESASGRSNLARNIEKQYYQRIQNLPAGTKQTVMIDIRGQSISDASMSALYDDIMRRTNNGVEILFKID